MLTSEEYKELSVKEFSKAAEIYESMYKICKRDYPDVIEEIEKEPFETLLDAGCGPAPILLRLTKKHTNKEFFGIDLTPQMIERAKKQNLPNTTFVIGDCENLPFKANSFDVIVCCQSFHHYPNPLFFFQSAAKCLKPNGRLIIRDIGTKNKIIQWYFDHIETPLMNIMGFGDVAKYTKEFIEKCCIKSNLRLETFEHRFPFRIHCVIRKEIA